jgi:aldehyde dehydrogenase (NAD+)
MSAAWKLGPALAAGCTIVLKPAEQTPASSLALARLIEEAGFPPGVVNVVPGDGPVAGARLVEHPNVDKIAFTGEGETAKTVIRACADSLKRFSFELGGKAPHIIFADADIDQALNAATGSVWTLCGQSCALGKSQGAELICGGSRIERDGLGAGYFVEPTAFAGVSADMRIAQEEIFGPVAALIPFSGEDEAVAIANGTRYGLTAGLWTADVGRAHRVASRIQAGMVWINTYRYIRWSTPYGGFKASGWGRENGIEALDSYLETRTTIVSTTGRFADPYAD